MNIHDRVDEIKFDEITLKKTGVIAKQILLYFCDFFRWYLPIFDKRRIYRIPFYYYDKFRLKDKNRFRWEMHRLQRTGFIKKYFKGKQCYLELTNKGKRRIKSYLTQDLTISTPKIWDRKWRIVIYDITDDKKNEREVFRIKLESLGFLKLQESVYVYPFECSAEIDLLKGMYLLSSHVQYLVAERIETEINLIKRFYERGILKKNML